MAKVSSKDASKIKVEWSSSDNNVVSVSDGVLKALKKGTATITAKAKGKSCTCEVTVVSNVYVAVREPKAFS